MLRACVVFEKKVGWRLKHDLETEGTRENDNYRSGQDAKEVLLEEFREQEKMGLME